MKKISKVLIYFAIVVSVLFLVFFNFNSDNSILGRVIDFSDRQEESGNVFSFLILTAVIVGFIVVFTFKSLLEEYFDKKNSKAEIDRLMGKV